MVEGPLTLLAAAGAWLWLGAEFAATWWAAMMLLIAINQALCVWIGRHPAPRRWHEAAVAAFTFVESGVYCLLALQLILSHRPDDNTAIVAAIAVLGGVSLSAVSEFVYSRLIGAASMATVLIALAATVLLAPVGPTPLHGAFALMAALALSGYLIQHAVRSDQTNRLLRGALAAVTQREAAAASANAAKSALVATMSHEIRTPLNGVLGMVQVMEGGPLVPAQRERLTIIRQSGEAMTSILEDVLDLSRAETGRLELDIREFELDEALEAACSPFIVRAEEKGLTLSIDIGAELSGRFRGDPGRLRQLIGNLLRNALKFTDAGGVSVSARGQDGMVHIAVADSGPGVPSDQADRMLRRFSRNEDSSLRRGGGGLGLAVAWELCALMGGRMEVENAATGGAVYTAILPLDRVGERAEPSDGDMDWSRLRVLAADDDRVNRLVLENLLSQIGVRPVLVSDGGQALAAWAASDWDLVLMDVHMGAVDGVSAVQEIRRRETESGRARTPVLALTGNAMAHQVAELLAAGMDGHVAKPIDADQLVAAMRALLEPAA